MYTYHAVKFKVSEIAPTATVSTGRSLPVRPQYVKCRTLAKFAKALCTLLAHIAKAHARHNRTDNLIASVATPLGCNQRRSIIPATQPERAPD